MADRDAPLDLSPDEFRTLGHALVDELAEFLGSLPERPVTRAAEPAELQALLPSGGLPRTGAAPRELLAEASRLLFEHSLFNGHPRFWGYITSSAAPIGALADLLAATVNPNVGGWPLSPIASEIERQTNAWIAELVGFPVGCGGILVSGGNMANFVGFLAARHARAPWNVREDGTGGGRLTVYASEEAHTWLQKAADLFGLGTSAIRWLPSDERLRMDVDALERTLDADEAAGLQPLLVVGTAGSVSTGAIDPLERLAALCRERGLWLHVDGAYGAFAAALPEASADLRALGLADSLALDPHKWLYAPLEAGCALVREPEALRSAFTYRPPYYHLADEEEQRLNYFEYGPQNSRGFRALKVWLALRQVGREGYEQMIADDIALARELYRLADADPELEAVTTELSITTFRFVPRDLAGRPDADEYLDELNAELLTRLEASGEAFVSNAVVRGRFLLRACVVNFRTALADIEALPGLVKRIGREADGSLRPKRLPTRVV